MGKSTTHGVTPASQYIWYESKIAELEGLLNREHSTAMSALNRLEELEEVGKREDGTWYWRATGEPVGGEE